MTGPPSSWREPELIRESVRNVFDPRSRHAFVVLAAAILGLALSYLLAAEWAGLERSLGELRSAGRNVVLFTSGEPGEPVDISVASCAALARDPGVERAGAVAVGEGRTFTQLGPLVPVLEVDPGLVPELQAYDAVVGAALADAPGVLTLRESGGQLLDALVGRPEPSGMAGLTTSVAVPLAGATTATGLCVAELSRFADADAVVPVLAASLRTAGGTPVGTTVLRESFDVLDAYRHRLLLLAPIAVGALGAAVAVLSIRTRSSELAAYRLSGTSRADLARLLLWEQAATSGVLVAFGSAGLLLQSLAGRAFLPDDPLWVWLAGLAWYVLAGAAAILGARGSPADLARDR